MSEIENQQPTFSVEAYGMSFEVSRDNSMLVTHFLGELAAQHYGNDVTQEEFAARDHILVQEAVEEVPEQNMVRQIPLFRDYVEDFDSHANQMRRDRYYLNENSQVITPFTEIMYQNRIHIQSQIDEEFERGLENFNPEEWDWSGENDSK